MAKETQEWSLDLVFSQADVAAYAQLTGDDNPIHFASSDAEGCSQPGLVHGMLLAGAFSRLLGTVHPGPGTVYLKQDFSFRQPVLAGTPLRATIALVNHHASRHIATFATTLAEAETGKVVLTGTAMVMNPQAL